MLFPNIPQMSIDCLTCSILISFTTFFLLLTATPSPSPTTPLPYQVTAWATFLGVTSASLAAIQYAPQLLHTYKLKLVGALSIPMMLIQSPGAVLMVLSIALRYASCILPYKPYLNAFPISRPGTNWTSTSPYCRLTPLLTRAYIDFQLGSHSR